ncbi:MAG: hypothetical protein M1833_003960 [Piccolia ochrophora]|nr:MAG: hypothetical protein M1833_003960 [Piccolia ochrophora]
MRHLTRLKVPAEPLITSKLSHFQYSRLCAACRAPISSQRRFSTTPTPSAEISFTEKIRRKIWGTDQPPGAADPYGDASRFDQTRKAPPVQEEVAEVPRSTHKVAAAASEDPSYVPAMTWDGMEEIGGSIEYEYAFEGFAPSTQVLTPQERTAAVHRAVIETFTLVQAKVSLSDVVYERGQPDLTERVQATFTPDGEGIQLVYPEGQTSHQIVNSLLVEAESDLLETDEEGIEGTMSETEPCSQTSPAVEQDDVREEFNEMVEEEQLEQESIEAERLAQLDAQIASWDTTWLSVPLTPLTVKFAVVKRVTRLTGVHIPDPVIADITNVRSLLTFLNAPPPPKKLADALLNNHRLAALPNVKVFDRRITPVDRHKAVGRWKVIERELENKGLPVLGRG